MILSPGEPYHIMTPPPLPPLQKGGRFAPCGRCHEISVGASLIVVLLCSTAFAPAGEPQAFSVDRQAVAKARKAFRLKLTGLAAAAKRGYGPEQVEGPPDVAAAGTNPQAWASLTADGQIEWLLCEYDAPVEARAVIVHESAFPGGLTKVSAFNADGDEIVAWEGDDPTPLGKPRGVSVIPIKLAFPVGRIRVTINSPAVPSWNEIDAIGLEDASGKIYWAKHVEASSTYSMPQNAATANSKPAYAPGQAAGPPDTTGPGDHATAWCPATAGGQPEWLECRYKTAQNPTEVVVHETLAPGGISRIGVFDENDREVTAWEGIDPTPRDQPWGVSVFPINVNFEFRKLKLYLNSPENAGYHEIDAVGLRDDGRTQWVAEADASSYWGQPQAALMNSLAMPVRLKSETGVRELQKEVETLRQQMQELREQLQELKKARKE